jgi:hypothetical protein
MDGAMPKTVLIILAAVVALIVIVVLTGMRYLRADDEDDFDDIPADHGRSRSRGSHPAASQARPRQGHADDLPDERPRERVGAARGARPIQGRDDRGTDRRGFDQRGMDQRGSSRADKDRSWREDSAITGRSGRPASAVRDQRPARNGRHDYDDISEPLPVARTASTLGRGLGADDYDSLPGGRTSLADYDREPRERHNGRDRSTGYEDIGGRGDGRDPRETRDRRDRGDSRPVRDSRDGRDRADLRDSRPIASIRDDSDRGERDHRSSTRPNGRSDKNGSKPDDELLPALKPRQSKNKRESEADWPSNEWDELSDVDYWAELASDKPFTAPSPAESPRSERRDARADRESKPERIVRADRDGRMDRDSRPDRDPRQDSRIGAEAITKQMSRPPREPDSGILPAARRRDLPAEEPTAGRSTDPRSAIADDDPLTSPSFPRVAADDSRSYHRSRSAPSSDPRHDGGRGSDSSRHANGGGRTPGDLSTYPSIPPVEPVRGFDSASTTRRHALPAASSDPYSSPLPSAPGHATSSVPANYQVPATSGPYQTPDTSYAGADGGNGSYSLSAPYGEPGGYRSAASYPAAASGGYPQANWSPSGGYLPPVGGRSGVAGDTSPGSYQSPPPAPDNYRPELGAGSYQGGAGYEVTGFQPPSSHSLPPGRADYGNGAGDYPGGGYQHSEYQGYGGPTSASGSHRRPEPSYPHESYQGAAQPSVPALPAGAPDPGYPVYPAPVPGGHNGYGTATPQAPGYDGTHYQPSGYDQAGYPLPALEANGYAGADPYAVEPHGKHGYGGNRH